MQWTYKLFLLSEQEEKHASLSVKENLLTSQENVSPQQRLLLWQLEKRRDELSENISKLSIADEEVSRLLSKADEAAKRAVAIQGSVHPDNNGSHLR